MTGNQARDLRLDGLRGLAILLVLLFHASFYPERQALAGRLVLTLPTVGFSGVDLFFVLSGFLITRILLERRGAENYYRVFWARRVLRIFPAYYLLLLVFGVVPALGAGRWNDFWLMRGSGEPLWYWFYLANFYDGLAGFFHHHLLAPVWSLAIEEQFYLVWPLLVASLRPRILERLCLVLVVLALGLRIVATLASVSSTAVYVLTPMRVDTLAFGAWVALRARREGGFAGLRALALRALPVTGVAVLAPLLRADQLLRLPVPRPGDLRDHGVGFRPARGRRLRLGAARTLRAGAAGIDAAGMAVVPLAGTAGARPAPLRSLSPGASGIRCSGRATCLRGDATGPGRALRSWFGARCASAARDARRRRWRGAMAVPPRRVAVHRAAVLGSIPPVISVMRRPVGVDVRHHDLAGLSGSPAAGRRRAGG